MDAAAVRAPTRQTVRRARPLLRRDETMDRPARVRMRRRKPCFLWRRRLFGWYVRFMRSFQSHDARERVIGPHRQPPSTTPVHDKGQRFQHTVRGRTRRIHPRLYTATRRGRSPTRRPPENRTVEVVHNRLSGADDRISVSASGKHRFPAMKRPPTAFHMGYPHCGELMPHRSQGVSRWTY